MDAIDRAPGRMPLHSRNHGSRAHGPRWVASGYSPISRPTASSDQAHLPRAHHRPGHSSHPGEEPALAPYSFGQERADPAHRSRDRGRGQRDAPVEPASRVGDRHRELPGADPVDVDHRGRDLRDGGSEVARACLNRCDVLKERPAPVRVAMPDGSIAGADRRRGKAAQRKDVTRSERQAHHAIAREAFLGSVRAPDLVSEGVGLVM